MKIIRTLTLFLLIFSAAKSISYSSENGNGDDLRYDREFLIITRDGFIAANGDLKIRQLVIRGLDKTHESVILEEYDVSEGDNLSAFDPHHFINRLKKKNIFTDLEISYIRDSESAVIELSLKEKWTVILLPVVNSNGEKTLYGLFLLESNFLGYGKTVFTGGTYSEESKSAMIGYVDPAVFGSEFIGNLFFTYKESIDQNGTIEKNIFSEYKSKQVTARIDAGYEFINAVKVYLSGGYNAGIVDHDYSDSLNPPDTQKFYISGAVVKYDFLKYYDYLYYGLKGEFKLYAHIPVDDEKEYNTADYKIDYSEKIFNFHRLTFFSSGSAGNKPSVLEDRISGKTGTRTLPADIIAADNYINCSIIYEYPVMRFGWGSVTLLGMWEQGIYNKDDSPYYSYYGTGGGILLYLKRIAFPAVGFNYAHNLKTGNNEFSVNVGYAF